MDVNGDKVTSTVASAEQNSPISQTQKSEEFTLEEIDTLYLVGRFLEQYPQVSTAFHEIESVINKNAHLLPKRYDYEGNTYAQTYGEIKKYSNNIGPDHLTRLLRVNKSQNYSLALQPVEPLQPGPPLYRQRSFTGSRLSEPTLNQYLLARELGEPIPPLPVAARRLNAKFEEVAKICGHFKTIYSVLFDATGSRVFTGSDDTVIKVWCVNTGALIATLNGHQHVINDMCMNKEGTLLASCSQDCEVIVWDLHIYQPIYHSRANDSITAVAFSPSPIDQLRCLLASCDDGMTYLFPYDRKTNTFQDSPVALKAESTVGTNKIKCITFNPTGSLFAVGGTDGIIRLFSTIGGKAVNANPDTPSVIYVDAKDLLTGDEYETTSGDETDVNTPKNDSSGNGQSDPAKDDAIKKEISEDSIRRPMHIADLDGHTKPILTLQFANHGNRLLSGSDDGTARIWEYNFEEQLWISFEMDFRRRPDEDVTAIHWSRDDSKIIVGTGKGGLYILESSNGHLLHMLEGHGEKAIYVIEPHPLDDHILMSAGYDSKIILWDIYNGKITKEFAYPEYTNNEETEFHDARWREDGTMFAVSDSAGYFRLFSLGESVSYDIISNRLAGGQRFCFDYMQVDLDEAVEAARQTPFNIVAFFRNRGPVTGWGGIEYESVLEIPADYGLNWPVGAQQSRTRKEDRFLRDMLNNELERLQSTGIIRRILDKKTLYKRRRQIQIASDHEEYDDFDPMTIDEPIIPLPNEDDDPEYIPGESTEPSERDSEDTDLDLDAHENNSDFGLDDDGDYYDNYEEDPEYRPTTRSGRIFARRGNQRRSSPIAVRTRHGLQKRKRDEETDEENNDEQESNEEDSEIANKRRPSRRRRKVNYKEQNTDGSDSDQSDPGSDYVPVPARDIVPGHSRSLRRTTTKSKSKVKTLTNIKGKGKQRVTISARTKSKAHIRRRSIAVGTRRSTRHSTAAEASVDYVELQTSSITSQSHVEPSSPNWIATPEHSANDAPNFDHSEVIKPELWLHINDVRTTPYIPQVGDCIVYFKRGHEQFAQRVQEQYADSDLAKHLSSRDGDKLLRWKYDPELPETIFAKVKSIEYRVGSPTSWARVKLEVVDAINATETDPTPVEPVWRKRTRGTCSLTVEYCDIAGAADFLVLYDKYVEGVNQNLLVGEEIVVQYADTSYTGSISSLGHPDPRMWQAFWVKWNSDSSPDDALSAWEMQRNNEIVSSTQAAAFTDEDLEALKKLIDDLIDDSHFEIFVEQVDTTIYPTYPQVIAYPICLQLVKQRLANGFYRRPEAIREDVKLIMENAMTFNDESSGLHELASDLFREFETRATQIFGSIIES